MRERRVRGPLPTRTLRALLTVGCLLAALPSRAEPPAATTTVRATEARCAEARSAVKAFLQYDYDFDRLWTPELKQLVADADNPGWDTFVVVESFHVESCSETPEGFRIGVRWFALGEVRAVAPKGFIAFDKRFCWETRDVAVVREGGALKVRGTGDLPPHVGVKRAAEIQARMNKSYGDGEPETARRVRREMEQAAALAETAKFEAAECR